MRALIVIFSLLAQIFWPTHLPMPTVPKQAATNAATLAVVADSKLMRKAGEANRKLLHDMKWEFAGTKQRGWYLYMPIISELIGCRAAVDSPAFVAALAAWQQQQGLSANGVLDEDSWMKMVELLQNNRLKTREYPPAEELVVVSPSEFFDPTRAEDLRKVHIKAYEAYKRMIAAARVDKEVAATLNDPNNQEAKNYFKIISSWRSREYQDELRKRQTGSLGRVALAKFSAHFTGRALDIYVGGEPVSTNDNNRAIQVATPAYRWLVHNAAHFGFRPYFYEPWHWEYMGDLNPAMLQEQQ
jgi:LAS superfamily LD-carboxypeptidase LdcB